ncbi:hypothetical protein [Actinocorallia populi]|uniref:hypothetical protein n=1 Tax=Actinocorallia populi TaxID=2079200 RepID=UPI000D088274|nr:hypothetical protein [Actinocorallia populi]
MRLATQALGALATAGILATLVPGVVHAEAANSAASSIARRVDGIIYVGKKRYVRPAAGRCYFYKGAPIKNGTGRVLRIFKDDECSTSLFQYVDVWPGAAVLRATGKSFMLLP